MKKLNLAIESNKRIAIGTRGRETFRMVLRSAEPLRLTSGQFVEISIPGFYLRRPISVSECEGCYLVILYNTVGEGTFAMSRMQPGDILQLLAPLGNGFDTHSCQSAALLVGGGIGAAPLYQLCKELIAAGKSVSVALGFNTSSEVILEQEFRSLGAKVTVATMDGTDGIKGLVTDAIAAANPSFDYFYTCGPKVMMKAVCQSLEGPGEASLEERMGCGAGYCYGCSIQTAQGPRRVCKDGPVFKKENLIWE